MRPINGDDVNRAVAGCLATLRPAVGRDWENTGAGRLEWSCRKTAEHVASALIAYAGQLAGRARETYVPFATVLSEGTDNTGLLHVVETAGTLLATTVRTTPPGVRAFHPYPFGSADREGFAAMGIAEVLLHTHDLAEGLGLAHEPAEDLAESVLSWIFPHVQPGPAPWPTLLWATGRGELPSRAPVTDWRWHNNLTIPTDRLTLTGMRPAAARDLRLGGDGGFTWAAGGPHEGTREAAGLLLKTYEAGVHRPEFTVFVLVRTEDGRAVGAMGFHGAPDEQGCVEIGYDLAEAARGQGYATEALRALTQWALARDDVRTLVAKIDLDNAPSRAVVTRAGFRQVAEDDTLVVYELRG